MLLKVTSPGSLSYEGLRFRCALGRAGILREKREGDGGTPAGHYALREVYYRADRSPRPASRLPIRALAPNDGWCDASGDPEYNRAVKLPYAASHEELWRADGLYDLFVVIGYNDAPATPQRGSAIFLHVAAPAFAPTQGCVALTLDALRALVDRLAPGDHIEIAAD